MAYVRGLSTLPHLIQQPVHIVGSPQRLSQLLQDGNAAGNGLRAAVWRSVGQRPASSSLAVGGAGGVWKPSTRPHSIRVVPPCIKERGMACRGRLLWTVGASEARSVHAL
eukprot:363216-Chlamydomonas_euryale.AAC.3